MFKYNEYVKDKNTGKSYVVVAPVSGEDETTVVWSDETFSEVLIFPTEELEPTEQRPTTEQFAHIVYDVALSEEDGSFTINRALIGIGVNPVLAAYSDLREYSGEIAGIPIETIDEIIEESKNV